MLRVSSVDDLQVGDIGFGMVGGRLAPTMVSLGQWLIDASGILRGLSTEQAWFTHTWIVIEKFEPPAVPSVRIIEAMPRGAQVVWLKDRDRIGPGFGWARVVGDLPSLPITEAGEEYIGTPYSFLDYLSLALLHLGLPRRLTARRVTDSGHMICSQLVDTILTRAGVHLFQDGRLPQDVTPGALFRRAGALGDVVWW